MCGTPLYMAPEVHEGKVYDSKVDMYSFGLMMWEMWFGKKAPIDLSSLSPDGVSRRFHREGCNAPPDDWAKLMTSCWDSNPFVRRTAVEARDIIKEVKHDYVK